MKVLFLSAWYPNRYDAMSGLFVRKHAQAVARFAKVCVLYLHADETTKTFEIITQELENVCEIHVYYSFCKHKFLRKISKNINYIRAFCKGYALVKKEFGKPDITQVNILTRTAALAYFLKITQKIPYTIIEQWSRYLPQNNNYSGFLRRKSTEFLVKRAAAFMPVSNHLKNAMQNCNIRNANTIIVHNVVDDFFFEQKEKTHQEEKRIVHVSCFDEKAKNVCGILRAAKLLIKHRIDFELIIVGNGVGFEKCYDLYKQLQFPENVVKFVGELAPSQVAECLKTADFFVLFSNYETASVVVAESLASGIPVVSTPTGIMLDEINETNGLLVNFNDIDALEKSMDCMLNNLEKYDAKKISFDAQKYSSQCVGEKLVEIYRLIIEKC